MERIEAFEQMLCDIQKQAAYEEEQMQKLKAAGKEKSTLIIIKRLKNIY